MPLNEYKRPSAPTHDAFRLGLRYLWAKLKERRGADGVDEEAEVQIVPPFLLDQIAPPISWDDAVSELDQMLESWVMGNSDCSPVQILVGPPGGGSYEVCRLWAERMGWPQVLPPTPKQILDGGGDWLGQFLDYGDSPTVIPGLERAFLRHHEGLSLVRRLVEALEGAKTRCLVQCDSWGWAYLNKALYLTSSLAEPLVMQALDSDGFRCWFKGMAQAPSVKQVREIDSGKLVMSFEECDEYDPAKLPAERDETGDSKFFDYLAWHSRGIPQVAWDIWRYGMRIADGKTEELDLGVRIWPGIGLPAVESGISQCESFLLHALLIHGGLPSQVIPRLIPFSGHEILQGLHQLRVAGLLQHDDGFWRVTPLGYPSVRQHLNNEGYLVDAF